MKKTAVYSTSMHSFKKWCKVRNIKMLKDKMFVDFEGEIYVPVIRLSDVRGQDFTDLEFADLDSKEIYNTCYQLSYRVRSAK